MRSQSFFFWYPWRTHCHFRHSQNSCDEVQIPVFAKDLDTQRIKFRRQSVALAHIFCTAKFNADFDHLLEGCKKRSVPIRGLTYDLVEPFLKVMLTY